MIISKSKRFIFAAFQKSGSSSVQVALKPHASSVYERWLRLKYRLRDVEHPREAFKHLPPVTLRELIGHDTWNEFFTFTFVRNPWDRLVSLYHYHRHRHTTRHGLAKQVEFDEWLRMGGTGSARRLMSDFIVDEKGDVIVNFVGRFESLEEDFAVICEKLNLNAALPHINKSRRRADFQQYYTDETRELVQQRFARDIELFNYRFDEGVSALRPTQVGGVGRE